MTTASRCRYAWTLPPLHSWAWLLRRVFAIDIMTCPGEVTFYCAEGQDDALMVHVLDAPVSFLGYYLFANTGLSSSGGYGSDGSFETTSGRMEQIGYSAINTVSGGMGPNFTTTVHFESGLVPGPVYITGGLRSRSRASEEPDLRDLEACTVTERAAFTPAHRRWELSASSVRRGRQLRAFYTPWQAEAVITR